MHLRSTFYSIYCVTSRLSGFALGSRGRGFTCESGPRTSGDKGKGGNITPPLHIERSSQCRICEIRRRMWRCSLGSLGLRLMSGWTSRKYRRSAWVSRFCVNGDSARDSDFGEGLLLFVAFCRLSRGCGVRAFLLQESLQALLDGEGAWERLCSRRRRLRGYDRLLNALVLAC